jgi:hypothetical protein
VETKESRDLQPKVHLRQVIHPLHGGPAIRKRNKLHRNMSIQQLLLDQPIRHLLNNPLRITSLAPLPIRQHIKALRPHRSRRQPRNFLSLLICRRSFLLPVSSAIGLEFEGKAFGDVGYFADGFLLQVGAEVKGVFAAPCVVGHGEEELGTVGGHAFYGVREGFEEAFYVGPDRGHRGAVVDNEDLESD